MLIHPIPPVYDKASEILILGSFPSVRSREAGFFYGHPQNRFWKVLKEVCDWPYLPDTIDDKRQFLLESHIALWDVIASCEITGSSDASIRSVKPNDFDGIIRGSSIRTIFCNGGAAYRLYMRYIFPKLGIEPVRLPSTSPANAAFTLPKLIEVWRREIGEYFVL